MSDWLGPVREALGTSSTGCPIFFRDDDVGWRDDRLVRLLDLFEDAGLPIDLAVIPMALDERLASELVSRHDQAPTFVGLHQHGFAHVNHELSGRKCEFGPARSETEQWNDIERGRRRLQELLGPAVQWIFSPPWNRCTEVTAACLSDLGFLALSRDASAEPLGTAGIGELQVNVDWFAKRKGIRLSRQDLGDRMGQAIRSGGPVGIMLHHAVMDETEFQATRELVTLLAEMGSAVRPVRMRELLQADDVAGRPA